MSDVPFSKLPIEEFLNRTGSSSPTPGGGSVAALTGSLAAALGRMVCAFTVGREKFAAVESRVRTIAGRLEQMDGMLRELMDEDAAAFEILSTTLKMRKDDESRPARVKWAASLAAIVPLATAGICRQIQIELDELRPIGNQNLASDIEVARLLARAGLEAAAVNVRVNLPLVGVEDADRLGAELRGLME